MRRRCSIPLQLFLSQVQHRYPRANFVFGHSGNTPDERSQAITAARENPNVYLETCSTFRTPGVIEQLVNEAGAERVLFGSDSPLMDPRPHAGLPPRNALAYEADGLWI